MRSLWPKLAVGVNEGNTVSFFLFLPSAFCMYARALQLIAHASDSGPGKSGGWLADPRHAARPLWCRTDA